MKALKFYTTRVDLDTELAVRRWGILGARRFWLGWGTFMYAFLALMAGYLVSAVGWESDDSAGPHISPYLAAALIVIAASMLTRMLVHVLAELRSLESTELKRRH